MPTKPKHDDRVTKRRVTMVNQTAAEEPDPDRPGEKRIYTRTEAVTTYVRPDFLDAFVTDARRRWQTVTVSDQPDAGPGGYDGATYIPFGVVHRLTDAAGDVTSEEWHEFPHELAGTYFPAAGCKDCDHAPEHPQTGEKARTIRAEA